MTIRLVGAEMFHADRGTYRHTEVSSRFSQFFERAQKLCQLVSLFNIFHTMRYEEIFTNWTN